MGLDFRGFVLFWSSFTFFPRSVCFFSRRVSPVFGLDVGTSSLRYPCAIPAEPCANPALTLRQPCANPAGVRIFVGLVYFGRRFLFFLDRFSFFSRRFFEFLDWILGRFPCANPAVSLRIPALSLRNPALSLRNPALSLRTPIFGPISDPILCPGKSISRWEKIKRSRQKIKLSLI